jgi:putative addiction module component (TIGR02574 family)
MVDGALLSRVKTLSPADRLELIGAVWGTFSPDEVPVTPGDKALLDARLTDLSNNPDNQSPWAEVEVRLRRQLP